MNLSINRRGFLTSSAAAAGGLLLGSNGHAAVDRQSGVHLKISLNGYSFNQPLRDGEMTLDDVIDYCAKHGFDAIDPTGYYFPGYPDVPSDEYIYHIKHKAFLNGLSISGTGVRNDFAVAEKAARQKDVQLVKDWIVVAQKLGAPVIRVFAGQKVPNGYYWDQTANWLVEDMKVCADFGQDHGVIVALQNHNDFLQTADETIKIVEAVASDWFGLMLDVGSLRTHDPYEEIEKLLPYAVSWQLKENVWYADKETPIELQKIKALVDKIGYRGFLPMETLGEGDPKIKVERFLSKVRSVFG